MAPRKELKLAVCLFPGVTNLDYQGPIELMCTISTDNVAFLGEERYPGGLDYTFKTTYLAPSLDPIHCVAGPKLLADRAYKDVKPGEQYDILLIPGGFGIHPYFPLDPSLVEFVKAQTPGAKYVLTVCTGSWLLAVTGILKGKKATSNKMCLAEIKEETQSLGLDVEWVQKARWVVDGNLWTASGVSAGMDMANAFLIHLVGEDNAKRIRAVSEYTAKKQDEDEFWKVATDTPLVTREVAQRAIAAMSAQQ